MEPTPLPHSSNNFRTVRNMWNSKEQGQAKPLQSTSVPFRSNSEQQQQQQQQQQQKSSKDKVPTFKITNETTTNSAIQKETTVTPDNEEKFTFKSIEKLPLIEENISLPVPPPPPPSVIFKCQAESVITLKQSVNKMRSNDKKKFLSKDIKNNGIHHWHIASHVVRSGLIFNRSRRASDSILPLLMKTHIAHNHSRTDSIDSTLTQTPLESLIDYLNYNNDNKENGNNSLVLPKKIKRSASDTTDCIRRNKLDDSISQYEMILRHLKNYDQFMAKYSVPSSSLSYSKQRGSSFNNESINNRNEIKENFHDKTSIKNRHTQSLSRNVGRSFTEFIMNDLFLSPSSKILLNERRSSNISHASSQTDLSEPIQNINDQINYSFEMVHHVEINRQDSIQNEEAQVVLNELDTILDNNEHELPLTANSDINVIVINSPLTANKEETLPKEKPLMQRLFEGKKTAYSPDDLDMKSIRLPEEMMKTYEIATKKCFFYSEQLIYTTKMIKVSRRGYKQHIRMLCITTERLYNITKKDPYPKEALLFNEIIGLTCTPLKDGFICIHTKDSHEDRGDWLVVVDHPCEFITQLFMIMRRDNNDDNFLKIESKFKHQRRFFGESSSSECSIEARTADSFRIKVADFDAIIIYTP